MNKYVKEVNLNAISNLGKTDVMLDINNNGNSRHYDLTFDNEELLKNDKIIQLENILNVPSVNMAIDKRLQNKLNMNQIAYIPDNNKETNPGIENIFVQIYKLKKTRKTRKTRKSKKSKKNRRNKTK